MKPRMTCVVLAVLASGAFAAPAFAHRAVGGPHPGGRAAVRVYGDVAAPVDYTESALAALPRVSLPDLRGRHGGTVTGVSVDALVAASTPTPATGKNPQLRVAVTVLGLGARTFALGELDPGFGDHPALLALRHDGRPLPGGPYLEVPGDAGHARTVIAVRAIRVDVVPVVVPTAPAGSVVVTSGHRSVTVGPDALAGLPQVSTTVTFSAAGVAQTHAESGPRLADVLRAARLRATPTTVVTAVGADGYAAAVTPAEATSGRRPLLISTEQDGAALARPRLIAAGDLSGGRDVSGVVALDVDGTR